MYKVVKNIAFYTWNLRLWQIRTDEKLRWNREVDRAIISGVAETEIQQTVVRMCRSFIVLTINPIVFMQNTGNK